jgi:3-deoxy-D-manno-octulosonic-acid transferase
MRYLIYNTVLTLAAGPGALWLAANARHRPLLGRFAPRVPAFPARPLWIHACSVGEVAVARALLRACAERAPQVPVLLTVSTVTGRAEASKVTQADSLAWLPFDHPLSVAGFLARARPRGLVLVETELWPNLLRLARRSGIPAVVVNGRLSDRRMARYRRHAPWLRPVVSCLDHVCAQSAGHAARFGELGVPADRVTVTGNLKFDAAPTPPPEDARRDLRARCGAGNAPVVVFGSTRPGDEAMAAACLRALVGRFPGVRLVVVPRHLDRADEVAAAFGEPVARWSRVRTGEETPGRVLLVDTMGELAAFYAIATVAVVGGSFDPAVGGHNPLEPAALGIPTVFGPHMQNFADIAAVLLDARGALQVAGRDALPAVLGDLMVDEPARDALATRGRDVVGQQRGATGRTLDVIGACVPLAE